MRKKWLEIEINYLKENYSLLKKEEIINELGRTWSSITCCANKLGLIRLNFDIKGVEVKFWSKEEDEYLINNYSFSSKEKMVLDLNRTWSSIQNRTRKLKIKREILNANSDKLIDGSNESYYWLGFIMADGHFNKNNQIQINLSVKDLEHLQKLALFVEYKGKILKPSINIGFGKIKKELNQIFNLSNDKTHNPCNLDELSGDNFFSFIIGFIDGDGTITEKGYLRIKCHKNWLNNLNKMIKFITNNDFNEGRINSEDLAIVQLTRIEYMKKIKNKILELNLPILKRKWDRVDLNKMSKNEKHEKMKKESFQYFEKGILPKEVLKISNLSRAFVYKIHKEYLNSIKEKDLQRELDRNN